MASIGNQLKADPWLAVELSLLMRVSGRTQDALVLTERGLDLHPDATEILLEKAEALNALGTPNALTEAMRIFKRLHNGVDRGSPVWWTCELRQLEILERMDTNTSQIGPRIERLRLFNPDLGGPATQRAFDALQARAQRRRLEDAGE